MKYYKITNENEKHNGMQYKDGLNVDIRRFNPSGNCQSGGIYFAGRDILAFLGYAGDDLSGYIREVTIPDGEQVYENPGEPQKFKAHRVILGPRRKITAEVIAELVQEGADVNCYNGHPLRYAGLYGNMGLARWLVENGADVNCYNGYPLYNACSNGHTDLAKWLAENGADVNLAAHNIPSWWSNRDKLRATIFSLAV